ncbi:ECF subfamily RNA polymerase sigma factor [Streptomyces laurentii]|uniref:ECF subfamily RNA polymerase sigma factor n=1 Tax=Streptomyces laurentii TaxID=39478 RepID=A0A160P0H4_STRLU|nr:ECF subfamily RNA polymerase sigma factor [Streptomyces laurentii]
MDHGHDKDRNVAYQHGPELLAERFEADRGQLRAVAYRMLGSLGEAEDAVQEAWIKLNRSDTAGIRNLSAWLTTVVGRICLDMLRSRTSRREDPLFSDTYIPDPVVREDGAAPDPEREALLADEVGLALLIVLETLVPAERLAFVLHDMFAVSFDEIAPIVDRSPAAARQLASRARRRVQDAAPAPAPDPARQREVVSAFLAASQAGDFEGLLAVLDPDVLLRVDGGVLLPAEASTLVRGAERVTAQALTFAKFRHTVRRVTVNGAAGLVSLADGAPAGLMVFTIVGTRVVGIDIIADRERLAALGVR